MLETLCNCVTNSIYVIAEAINDTTSLEFFKLKNREWISFSYAIWKQTLRVSERILWTEAYRIKAAVKCIDVKFNFWSSDRYA